MKSAKSKKRLIDGIVIVLISMVVLFILYKDKVIRDEHNIYKHIYINYKYPYEINESKSELFLKFFGGLYDFTMSIDNAGFKSLMKRYKLKDYDSVLEAISTLDENEDIKIAGLLFERYYLKKMLDGKLTDQRSIDRSYVGFMVENNMNIEFLKYTMLFFYYWRLDEGVTGYKREGRNPYGSDYFASPYSTVVDIAKFFYYDKDNLPNHFYVNTNLIKLYDEIPSISKKPLRKNDECLINRKKSYDLINEFDVYGYEFDGWYVNEDYEGEKIEKIDYKIYDKYGENITLYAKFKPLNVYDDRLKNLKNEWK